MAEKKEEISLQVDAKGGRSLEAVRKVEEEGWQQVENFQEKFGKLPRNC